MKRTIYPTVLALAIVGAGQAVAQSALEGWNYNNLYDDNRITGLIDADVYTSNQEEIGDVEDVFINERGQIQTVVIEKGGLLGLGEEYIQVPFANVTYDPVAETLLLSQTKAELEKLPARNSEIKPGADQWSAENLIDMAANMDGHEPYGEIDELLWDPHTNQVSSIVLEPDGWEAERYALPWGEGSILNTVDKGYVYFPYREPQLATLGVFILDNVENQQQSNQQNADAKPQNKQNQKQQKQSSGAEGAKAADEQASR